MLYLGRDKHWKLGIVKDQNGNEIIASWNYFKFTKKKNEDDECLTTTERTRKK